jgi:2-dehydro-3-deoxyphosphogluconate aldolase/(4S)-4-hydroxy-2-oxoglutarate aldolase
MTDVEKAVPLAKALAAGGIPCAEVTFRTAQGEECIRRIAAELPDILVGAGTVLATEQVDRALAAGAKFIVSPGFNPEVVKYCIAKDVPVIPGCITPTEMEAAMTLGLTSSPPSKREALLLSKLWQPLTGIYRFCQREA